VISAARFQFHILRAVSLAVLAVLTCSATLSAQTLMWNANTESNVGGYIVQYGTQSGSPSTSIDVGNVTSRAITGLTAGTTYYFQVIAYTTTGVRSAPSTQITYTVPGGTAGPTISSLSPTSGPTTGGTVITINGTGFAAGATVRVGGALATGTTLLSATQVRAATPAGTAGARDVVVMNPNGSSATRSGAFTYTSSTSAPTATAVSPTSGPTTGGTVITVTGANFVSGATINIGGTAATGVTFVSATQLRATTPAKAAGGYVVQVVNPNGQSANTPTGFTYTASTSAPTATLVSPNSGPTTGGTVITVTGTNFVSGATVNIGGTAATGVTFVSSTRLQARTPAKAAGGYAVQVVNPNGQSANTPSGFTYTSATAPAPTATSLSPTSGPTTGGTVITVTGTNFVSGARVNVGGTAATGVAFISATQLRATTPAKAAGGYTVQVVNPNGQSANTPTGFTYTASGTGSGPAPTLSLITPASGPASGGTTITLAGNNFVSGATVRIGGVAATNVVFGGVSRLSARTPAGTAGAKDVTVTNPSGQSVTVRGVFTYTGASSAAAASSLTESASPATFSRYLAEGVETGQMNTQLAIANPQESDAQATLTFETSTGEQTQMAVDVPARSRRSVDLSTVPELSGASFSTRLESDKELALDRLISFDEQGSGASLETAVDQPAARWYFAEGSTIDPQELFYLVQNPGATEAQVQVRYLLPNGAAPIVRTYTVAAGSRATIWVDRENPALASTDVAAEITSVDGTPIVVERSLYLRQPGSAAPRGGDSSTGVTAPATRWFVEGATGQYTTRLLLANPGSEAADVRATYQRADGRSLTRSYTLAPNSRQTVDVASVHPSLANATLDITVDASAPIVVERTKWWGANGTLDEAVSGAGSTAGGPRWVLAEGQQGGERQAQTSVVVLNKGAATDVKVTLLFEDGPEATATFPVAAGARLAVPMAEAFPAADGRKFSVLVEGADATANLVVDRAIFWQAAGSARTAGADGAASRLR
jgi:hypothetical protein